MPHSPRLPDDPDDGALLERLGTGPFHSDTWQRLTALADDFSATPHSEDDVLWEPAVSAAGGGVAVGRPRYGRRVEQACDMLGEVGAVTPAYRWKEERPPALPATGAPVTPADAVRLATTVIRAERFCPGTIAQAVTSGTLQAVLVSLARWHAAREPG